MHVSLQLMRMVCVTAPTGTSPEELSASDEGHGDSASETGHLMHRLPIRCTFRAYIFGARAAVSAWLEQCTCVINELWSGGGRREYPVNERSFREGMKGVIGRDGASGRTRKQ